MRTFDMPDAIRDLVFARNRIRDHYADRVPGGGDKPLLSFTLDGNLVGDIGEALAVELFGITLVDRKSHAGIDGHAPDGRTVQVKATGTGRGPVFRMIGERAEHLLFFDLDFDEGGGTVVYNGPEAPVIDCLPEEWRWQRGVSRARILALDAALSEDQRLPFIRP